MPVALITGCSSGFGRATALAFARHGYRVFATVRDQQSLTDLAVAAEGTELQPCLLDVTDDAAAAALVRDIIATAGAIDVLVNNAGIAHPGTIEDLEPAVIEQVMRTNFLAPLALSRAVLPHMRRRGSGRIIMISSLSALVGLPAEGAYGASKAALEAASESLRHEVARFGIHVSVVEPGQFNTAMPGKILNLLRAAPCSPYAPLMEHLRNREEQGAGRGDDTEKLAAILLHIAAEPRPAFRYAAGPQAERVLARLRGLDAESREDFIRSVNDTCWWSEGEPGPPG